MPEENFWTLWCKGRLTSGRHSIQTNQVVKVIWHKATSPPQMDSSIVFATLCQCTFPWGHIGTTWWIRWNMQFLQSTWAHNPNSKSIGPAVFAQLTAESAYTLQWAPPYPKIAASYGGSGPSSNTWFLGQTESSTQTASRTVQPFFCRAH